MKPTLFILGPSDIESQNPSTREYVEGKGWKVVSDFSGVLPIMDFVEKDKKLSANSRKLILAENDVEMRLPREVNAFNLVGDADASSRLLQRIEALTRQIRPRRLFNPPRGVIATSRSRLPKTLAKIPGCTVPRTEAADPKNFDDLRSVCSQFNNWPMIIRARGYHGGEHMQLLFNEHQLEKLENETWPYDGIFLIEYIDSRTEDGLYQKVRVIMVDGVPYARQCVFSDQWMVHSGSRGDLMNDDSSLRQRELEFLEDLRERGLGEQTSLFQEMQRRIGLDVFGIDFALVDGRMTIFEANACMWFLGKGTARNKKYQYLDPYKKDLRRAIKKMLLQA